MAQKIRKLAFEMNNLRSNKTDPAQAIRKANIALVTVNREDSLTQLVKAHAIKTKPAVIHSYVRLHKFKSRQGCPPTVPRICFKSVCDFQFPGNGFGIIGNNF